MKKMNILTFDTEEWYIETQIHGGREFKFKQFDDVFHRLLDLLDELGLKGTFFCLGRLASDFPYVVKDIAARGHEVGCHSNEHKWLSRMTPDELRKDTSDALAALEDIVGARVTSYRAPAFSIGESNKWAVEVLASCGIENDASIFPASRDFGGFDGFGSDSPCTVSYNGSSLHEFPICLTSVAGKRLAFSGGGYFRVFPYGFLKKQLAERDYTIWYFHLNDLISEQKKFLGRQQYEDYYGEPGTLKNRCVRYLKGSIGSSGAYEKMARLLSCGAFSGIRTASEDIDWSSSAKIEL